MSKDHLHDTSLKVVIDQIGVNYQVLDYLGGGGFAKTYLCHRKITGERVALKIADIEYLLKVFKREGIEDVKTKFEENKNRFRREAQTLYNISHPNVVELHTSGLVKDENRQIEIPYLIMEYIEGDTLRDILKEDTPSDTTAVYRICGETLSALDALHKKETIHLDIKPRNIVIERSSGRAVLIDFGLAKDLSKQNESTGADDETVGTPGYMPPEQIRNLKGIDYTADVYSAGVVLYEMLTGEAPFPAKSTRDLIRAHVHDPIPGVREIRPTLPEGIEHIIFKAMAKKPEDRYRNAGEFLTAIRAVEAKENTIEEECIEEVKKKIGDTYEVGECLSREGLFLTCLARHRRLDSLRLLKILKSTRLTENDETGVRNLKQRFIEEGTLLAKVGHENIQAIHDVDTAGEKEIPFLIMEYIKGNGLDEIIKENAPLNTGKILKISKPVLSALKEIKRGNQPIVHGDIKPGNIIIEEDSGRIVLTGFGFSAAADSIDSRYYMSPESCENPITRKTSADLYSLGAVLFEMVTGERPFKGIWREVRQGHLEKPVPDVREMNPDAPAGMQRIINKAMAKKPGGRYRGADDFFAALERLEKELQIDNPDLDEVIKEIGDTYEIVRPLGEGGFARVYLVRHKELDSLCTLKVMKHSHLSDYGERDVDLVKKRFLREGRILGTIKHDNIVKIHDVGTSGKNGIPYLIMDYVEGACLSEFIKENAPLKLEIIRRIMADILSAIGEMHSRRPPVIHRDIKPGNIMIEEKSGRAILIDFFLAKAIRNTPSLTAKHETMGTAYYMSPEHWQGIAHTGPAADIYSLGVVLYEMATGEVPFKGDRDEVMYSHQGKPVPNILEKNPETPPGLQRIIEIAMAKKPGSRYWSADDFLSDLERSEDMDAKVKPEETEPIRKLDEEKKRKAKEEQKRKEEELRSKQEEERLRKAKRKRSITITISIIISVILIAFIIIDPLYIIYKDRDTGDGQYRKHLSSVNGYIETGEFEKARASLEDAKKIKDTPEIKTLSGQIQQIMVMKTDFEGLAERIGKEADKEKKLTKLRGFIAKHQDAPRHKGKQEMLSWADNYITQLNAGIKTDKEIAAMNNAFQALKIGEAVPGKTVKEKKIADCNNFLAKYKDATHPMVKQINDYIAKLMKEINVEEYEYERKNGKEEYDRIKGKINLSSYLGFVEQYKNSVFIDDLKQRLSKADPNLPPEKYWPNITKNSKGYYEKTFQNGHIMIYIPEKRYWFDKYEVSIKQFRNFYSKNISEKDNYPVTVTFDEAQRYCDAYGFHLPVIDEWEYAAGKAKGYTYPWGNAAPDAGGIYRANFDTLLNGREQDGHSRTAPVKSFERFSSPFGCVNMAGNVWEWVQGKILKGGDYISPENDLSITQNEDGQNYFKVGFRSLKEEK